jgi:hypothetical protein
MVKGQTMKVCLLLLLGVVLAGCRAGSSGEYYPEGETVESLWRKIQHAQRDPLSLHICFEGGFVRSKVEVLVDGEKVYLHTISTDLIIGLAESIDIQLKAPRAQVTVVVNDKDKVERVIDLSEGVYLRVDWVGDKYVMQQSTNLGFYH